MKKCFLENKHIEMAENMEKCFACWKKIGISFDERINILYKNLITEKMKEDFIKSIREGKTIWEAKKEANLPHHEYTTLFTWKIIFEKEKIIRYLDLWEGVKIF